MQFNSLEFIIFLPAVVIGYYLIRHDWRWIWLCAAGAWCLSRVPLFALPLLAVALIEYSMSLCIERKRSEGVKSGLFFLIGVISPILLLALFKFVPIFQDTGRTALGILLPNYPGPVLDAVIPLGLSYYALQGVSYIIEVNRGAVRAERHFGIFALYLLFFPKLTAGPIERPAMIRQFRERHEFEYDNIRHGLRLIARGFFKKLVIADRVGIVANEVFGNVEFYHGIYFIAATAFFAVQLYCDFSGYTDIARGAARLMGFRLMENFEYPYGSQSLSEFWRRWHISLSSWLRDYLYIPMGGNRKGRARHYINIFLTFIASGIWHGTGWNFIAWGGIHGAMVVTGLATSHARERLANAMRMNAFPRVKKLLKVTTTGFLVCFAWIFFRAESISQSATIIRRIIIGLGDLAVSVFLLDSSRLKAITDVARNNTILGFSRETYRPEMLIAMTAIALLWFLNASRSKTKTSASLTERNAFVSWFIDGLMLAGILLFGVFSSEQFIYFRF